MLDRLTARTGLLLDRTSQIPVARLILKQTFVPAYRNLAVFSAFSLLCTVLVWPIFGSDYPPGVDTATFLHLSWVTELAVSGQLADPFRDPYWYGGFPYLLAYPPLGYGLVGITSFITGADLISVYVALLIMAYGGLATATYWFAGELGLRPLAAALAGTLVALAYPVLGAVFLWGWFTSMLALPLGLVGLMLLERSLRTGRHVPAIWGGLFMALSILTHHMTGISIGLGMVGWFLFHIFSGIYHRRQVVVFSGIFVGVMALIVAPWGIPSVIHILDVGFRREIPGLWLPDLANYRISILDRGHIGAFSYPSYLGVTLTVLAIAGTAYALVERRRLAGVAIALLVMTWFSLGANSNPLIRVYPFSGLDVARFHLYMVPFMALLGAGLFERVFDSLRDLWPSLTARLRSGQAAMRLWYLVLASVLAAILVFPALDAWKAREFMRPYQVNGSVAQALDWLAEPDPSDDAGPSPVYSVGLWTWHTFLIPYLSGRPLVDGWHDEGADNVHEVRQLRLMGWTGDVDIERAHELLSELGAEYVLVNRVSDFRGEASEIFWDGFEDHPEWFEKSEQWGELAVFRVVP